MVIRSRFPKLVHINDFLCFLFMNYYHKLVNKLLCLLTRARESLGKEDWYACTDATGGFPAKWRLSRETSAEIPYWWQMTTQIWVLLLIGWSKISNQSEALPRSGQPGISALVSQNSFRVENTGGFAKYIFTVFSDKEKPFLRRYSSKRTEKGGTFLPPPPHPLN